MAATDDWHQVVVEVAAQDVDVLSGALWAAGAAGVQECAAGSAVRLVVAVPGDRVDQVVAVVDSRPVEVGRVAADEGRDAWTAHVPATRVGPLDIGPVAPGPNAVAIDPGRAFGWGGHVTTRLALELLVAHMEVGARVLDVGTGTGVLAVAATRLGAASVLAVDVDVAAREAATANVARNRLTEVIEVADAIDGVHDLVVANLLAPELAEVAPSIVTATRAGGTVLLSGLLADQVDAVRRAYSGVAWFDRRDEGEWSALAARRRS